MVRNLLFAMGAMALGTFVAQTASADTTDTFALNDLFCNCIPSGSSAGSVGLTFISTGTDAGDVKFVVTLSGVTFHDTNAFDSFAFNYTGGDGALSVVSGSESAGFTGLNPASGRKEDGACTPNSSQCYSNWFDVTGSGTSSLTFILSGASGAFTYSAMQTDFETDTGASNTDFAAAITNPAADSCTGVVGGGSGTAQSAASGGSNSTTNPTCTGGGGGGGGGTVPEPSSVLLLGTAGLGIVMVMKRRFGSQKQS